jgi:hypothetical protein
MSNMRRETRSAVSITIEDDGSIIVCAPKRWMMSYAKDTTVGTLRGPCGPRFAPECSDRDRVVDVFATLDEHSLNRLQVGLFNSRRQSAMARLFPRLAAYWLSRRGKVSAKAPVPPMLAESLLSLCTPAKRVEYVIGDMNERFRRDCQRYGERRAKRMYWSQVRKRSSDPTL